MKRKTSQRSDVSNNSASQEQDKSIEAQKRKRSKRQVSSHSDSQRTACHTDGPSKSETDTSTKDKLQRSILSILSKRAPGKTC